MKPKLLIKLGVTYVIISDVFLCSSVYTVMLRKLYESISGVSQIVYGSSPFNSCTIVSVCVCSVIFIGFML
jgi:hypothetical protein